MEYKVTAKVKEIRFPSGCDLQVGDAFELERWKINLIKGSICGIALNALYPFAFALRYGAELSWAKEGDSWVFCCPDPKGLAIFELKREPIQP